MARKIPRDCSISEWSTNPFVEAHKEYSLIKEGIFNTELLVPISHDRRVCFPLHKIYAEWKYSRLFSSVQFIENIAGPLEEISDAIIFTAPNNHWHFNIDGMANISEEILERCNAIYVDKNISDDQINFLEKYVNGIINNSFSIKKMSEKNYVLKDIYVPTNKPFSLKVSRLKSYLSRVDANGPDPDNCKRLYVTRKGAQTRRLTNEDELLTMLVSEFNFQCVKNEDHNLFEQLEIFKNAEIVLGPHGAGLTNIIFSKNPHLLIELYNSFRQPFFEALSQALNIKYLSIEGNVDPRFGNERHSDDAPFSINVQRLSQTLRDILNN